MLVNGERESRIAATDRGLHYGDGLFETLAVIEGKPCLWQRHMARLQQGCTRLGISMPDPKRLWAEAKQEIAGAERGVLKIIVTRGQGGRGYRPPSEPVPTRMLHLSPWPDYPDQAWRQGITARVCHTRLGCNPALAGIKHLNRLEQVLARAEWQDGAIAEGIMLDAEGRVIEGTMSNLFMLREGRLVTPDLSRCGVAGVMRALIIDLARAQALPVSVEDVCLDDLLQADALFFSNSLIGIWPVQSLRERSFSLQAIPQDLVQAVMTQGFAA